MFSDKACAQEFGTMMNVAKIEKGEETIGVHSGEEA